MDLERPGPLWPRPDKKALRVGDTGFSDPPRKGCHGGPSAEERPAGKSLKKMNGRSPMGLGNIYCNLFGPR